MKLIKPSYQVIKPTGYTINDIYKSIELVGRVSHKSEDKITENSAKTFVDRIINWGHNSCLEFGTVYLQFFWSGAVCQHCNQTTSNKLLDKYANNKYSIVNYHGNDVYVTTNLRVLVENNWIEDLKYLCEPTEYHHKRYTVKFICDRGILAEFTRHRRFSFMAESSRYCNYSKSKFNNEPTFIIPCWINDIEEKSYCAYSEYHRTKEDASKLWFDVCMNSEDIYIDLLDKGWKPEQARAILPLSLKTELYMCGFTDDWEQFFKLRDNKQHAHPQAYELAHPLHEEFIKRNYLK